MGSSSLAMVQPRDLLKNGPEPKDLLCDICIDVITDLDQWLTSDTTEDQIVEWIEQVCDLLSVLVPEAICKSLIESQIPAIIDGLVNDNLNPQELCGSIGACTDAPTPAPTTPHHQHQRLQHQPHQHLRHQHRLQRHQRQRLQQRLPKRPRRNQDKGNYCEV